jgi:hypothetical protein
MGWCKFWATFYVQSHLVTLCLNQHQRSVFVQLFTDLELAFCVIFVKFDKTEEIERSGVDFTKPFRHKFKDKNWVSKIGLIWI